MVQSGLIVVQFFALAQSLQDVGNYVRIRVKFSYVMADIFVGLVPKHLEFGLVGPEYFAADVHLMDAFGGVFKKIRKLAFSAHQGLFDLLAPGDLGFERAGLLLQERDGSEPLVFIGLAAIAL